MIIDKQDVWNNGEIAVHIQVMKTHRYLLEKHGGCSIRVVDCVLLEYFDFSSF